MIMTGFPALRRLKADVFSRHAQPIDIPHRMPSSKGAERFVIGCVIGDSTFVRESDEPELKHYSKV